jgi:hypothetical protein
VPFQREAADIRRNNLRSSSKIRAISSRSARMMRRNMPNTSYPSLRACHSRRDQRPHGAYSWEADSPHMSTDRCPPSFVAPARSYSRWNTRGGGERKPPRSEDELACAARGDGWGTCWLGVEDTHRSTASAGADRPLSALPEPSSSSGITRLTPPSRNQRVGAHRSRPADGTRRSTKCSPRCMRGRPPPLGA